MTKPDVVTAAKPDLLGEPDPSTVGGRMTKPSASNEPSALNELSALTGPGFSGNGKSWRELIETLPMLRMPKGRQVLIVAPHPDDETLGLGGLIHEWIQQGIDIRVLIVSDGGASHRHSRLVDMRKAEALAAAAVLGVSSDHVYFLEFCDAHLSSHHAEIVTAIQASVPTDGRHCVVLSPRLNDGHPDHDACARAAAEVAQRLSTVEHWNYGVWTWTQGPCVDLLKGAFRWPIGVESYKAKWDAIGMYASQVTAMIGEQIVTDQLLESISSATEVVWC
jgi:LmbE family N-acetylglucosaminyl deacetylase